MTRTEVTEWLHAWFGEALPASPALGPILDAMRVADGAGLGPANPNYVETFDPWLTASAVAEHLAITAAMMPTETLNRVTAEGATFEVSTSAPDWSAIAAWLRSRSPLMTAGQGIGMIELARTDGPIPRSHAHYGVTGWADGRPW